MNIRRNNSGTMIGMISLIAALILLAVIVLPVSALQLSGQDVTATAAGGMVEYPIILDESPAGLANYSITVTLADPAVGEITTVAFPSWATLASNSTLPADTVNLTAADLSDGLSPGSTGITLATLTLRADVAGTTPVMVTLDQMNDDNGNVMIPAILAGSFTVTEAPVPALAAQFSGMPVSGDAPLTVAFTDESTGDITNYSWDFENDGIIDSTEQNPEHIYSTTGTYTVNLTVTGPGGIDDETKTDYITVAEAPIPVPVGNFAADLFTGDAPLTVVFTDQSTGDITDYAWDFENDGIIDSAEQNPEHIYSTVGTYTVNLTVTGPGGSDDETKTDYITVTEAPIPAPAAQFSGIPVSGGAPLTVAFTDESTGDITEYAWDFENDGIIDSAEQNPVHIYTTAGQFTVSLQVSNADGSDTVTKEQYISVSDPTPSSDGIRAEIRIEPETLNLKSSGVFTAFITLPGEYSVTDINSASLVCEGANAKSAKVINEKKNEYMVKFERQDLKNVFPGDSVTLTVSGNLNTDDGMVEFTGSDTIRVID